MKSYLQCTKTGTYGFISALPLLFAYEILILLVNSENILKVRVGADIWLKEIFSTFGLSGQLALGIALLFIGGLILFRERKKKLALQWIFFPLMFLESLFYSVLLAAIISQTVAYLFNFSIFPPPELREANAQFQNDDFWLQIALSIGAGLYEELFFRVLLVNTLTLLFCKIVFDQKDTSYLTAVLIAAFLFSLVHYLGAFGDTFTLQSFTFRFLFGLAFNFLYVFRGFGIVAWTHALYDIILTISLRG